MPRVPVLAGLLSGAVVAALVVAAIVFLAPGPAAPAPSASPPGGLSSSSAPASAAASPATSPAASPAGTPDASGSAIASASGSPTTGANFHVGEVAPPLRLPQVGGGTVDLGALRGRPVWINFMRTDCPPCRDEFPLMNGFAARYTSTGLVVVAVDVREPEAVADDFARSLNATFPVALDADGAVQTAWGAIVLPVHFWIDNDGVIRDGALGGIGPDIMAAGLTKILGVTVTP
jgi:cytochrome c biogenesis protein CcmG, thiol:disulfide interchange protein DsbE